MTLDKRLLNNPVVIALGLVNRRVVAASEFGGSLQEGSRTTECRHSATDLQTIFYISRCRLSHKLNITSVFVQALATEFTVSPLYNIQSAELVRKVI